MTITEKIELLIQVYQSLSRVYDEKLAVKYGFDYTTMAYTFNGLLLHTPLKIKITKELLINLNKIWNIYKNLTEIDIVKNKYPDADNSKAGCDALKKLKEHDNNSENKIIN